VDLRGFEQSYYKTWIGFLCCHSNWSNLADLQKWLLMREFTYQFQSHERYKGAEYSGKWTLGLPNIQ